MTLDYEISGDEIIVEVFGGVSKAYYRVGTDGQNKEWIGSLPAAVW